MIRDLDAILNVAEIRAGTIDKRDENSLGALVVMSLIKRMTTALVCFAKFVCSQSGNFRLSAKKYFSLFP